ncbi:MAG: S41 family peptidase [Jatrophihabitans sp.]
MLQAETADIVSRSADLVAEHYLFADVGETVAGLLRTNLINGGYGSAGSAEELGALVTADLQSANDDGHLRLKFHAEPIPDMSNDEDLYASYLAQSHAAMHGVAKIERLKGNIGHLVIEPVLFPAAIAGDALSAALRLIADTEAIILDLRGLRGGDPGTVALICSYFVDEPTHINTMHDRGNATAAQSWTLPYVPGPRFGATKPIWVLTSKATFSGGEELSYDLQQMGRAAVVGETTGGGAHARIGFTVHPHLELTVPVVRAENPNSKANWEGTGVLPDVPVPAEDAFATALRLARDHLHQPA